MSEYPSPEYLVTGGAGFIGSNLVEHLVNQGKTVRVIDDFSTGKRENLAPWADKIEIVEGSICNPEDCARAVEGVTYVLHQAATPSVPKSIEFPRETTEVNVMGTTNMLVAARDAGVKRMTYAASSSAYGDTPTLPKVETMPTNPRSPYALQKLTGEHMCRIFFEQYGLQTVAIRYFNVFGPRQDPSSHYSAVIPKFITAYLRNESPTIYGDGQQSRDFTYIDNVVHANLLACTASDECAGKVFNIACGQRLTLLELADTIREALGASASPKHLEERAGDVRDSLADITKAQSILGYEVQVPFKQGIELTIEAYKALQPALS
ncbi:SDR family oxidoreductase [Adhaeretor mobilis]|uniref:UDP-glucose 4-epimerase n=1 Tax=Adhaeretor mobilis TaxID=1930276 RepID=A0A517MPZ5_9BACT|nr:SDR family oxidoreductase [Adhaeretor mobilis]QDS96949.1 UDP-glucose 4-epimerase [Adhaeretor mobilis]